MKIGVLGTGDVGRKLASGLAGVGHEVMIGSRHPEQQKVVDWVGQTGPRASAGTFADAARFAELAVLATKWEGTRNVLKLAGAARLAGKVVIDVTNPLDFSHGAPPRLAVGWKDSGGERVQKWLPKSKVVKTFNMVGYAHMVNPSFPGGPPDMFICGNDAEAKKSVDGIVRSLGWPDTIDIGGIEGSRLMEPLCLLWVVYAVRTNTWNHAFKLLRK